jgi:hypothetical protein
MKTGAPGGTREWPSEARPRCAATRSVAANPRPSGSKTDPGVRSDAYLHLLLCEQRRAAARSGAGDGSRRYPAPDSGHVGAPLTPDGVGTPPPGSAEKQKDERVRIEQTAWPHRLTASPTSDDALLRTPRPEPLRPGRGRKADRAGMGSAWPRSSRPHSGSAPRRRRAHAVRRRCARRAPPVRCSRAAPPLRMSATAARAGLAARVR